MSILSTDPVTAVPAPSQCQWEIQPQGPGNQDQVELMFTKEQGGSLEMLLLETSQAAILFSLPSHISSTANSLFPEKNTSLKHHHSQPHLHPLFSPSLPARLHPPIIHPSNVPALLTLHPPWYCHLCKHSSRFPQNLCFSENLSFSAQHCSLWLN